MAKFQCTLEADFPIYEALSSEVERSERFDAVVEKTRTGVRIRISAEDASSLTIAVNHWLRLIKASSTVVQVI